MNARKTYFILFLFFGSLIAFSFRVFGSDAWRIWNIPTLQPSFVDARIIAAGAESSELGLNPDIENPRDPYGRLFNLPAVWKVFFYIGLDQSHTGLFAGLLIALFIIGMIIFPDHLNRTSAWLLAFCAFSPPILLAFERGNVDLLVFFVCSLFLVSLDISRPASIFLLWFASILKIYPVFGLASLLNLGKKSFIRFSACILVAFGIYAAFTLSNFHRVFVNTEKGYDLAYGAGVIPYYVGYVTLSSTYEVVATLVSSLLILFIFVICLYLVDRGKVHFSEGHHRQFSAFRLGAGIYVGTFLLGNNWDYRLMFLLFTIPQLCEWMGHDATARYTLLSIIVSFCYLWLALVLPIAYFLDELANWIAFSGLCFLMIASLPDWARNELHLFFVRYKVRSI